MDRRRFVIGSLAALVAPGARAQKTKVARVGYVSMASPDADRQWVAALRQGLRDLGYVEGKNLVFEQRHAYNQAGAARQHVEALLRRGTDVIVVYGSPAIAAIKESGVKVPVVMTVHADPVGSGIVKSLARPGGNITGFTDGHADLAPKRLELLKEIAPSVSRVAALYNPATPHAARQWKLIQEAAPRLGIRLTPVPIKAPDEVERAFEVMAKARANGLFVAPDPSWWVGHQRQVAELALQQRLASIGTVREFAVSGFLAAYGTNFTELWRRTATYVDKILKGAKAGELPIEHPRKFDLVINLKTASALGITVPRAVIRRADHVLE